MVYINYLSTRCTFIYPPLKILKVLATNYKPGQRKYSENLNFGKGTYFRGITSLASGIQVYSK